jgi:hypothetical protein
MKDYFIISLVYPDHGPVWFLFWMLCVIALAIWWGMKE